MRKFLLALLIFISASDFSQAAITLTINTSTKELWFSGSDSGTGMLSSEDISVAVWRNGLEGAGTNLFVTSAFSSDVGALHFVALGMGSSSGFLSFDVLMFYQGFSTITANSAERFNYASTFSLAQQQQLEAYAVDGVVFNEVLGTGFSPLSTNAVPEPSTCALLALGAGAVFWQVRRRRMA